MGRKVCVFMSIAMFQKVVRTIIYAPYQFRQDRVFLNKYLAMNTFNSLAVIRLSEMYLTAAEAAAKTGDATKAAKYLNAIVLRANPNVTPVTEAEATVARISVERRKELVGEGHRLLTVPSLKHCCRYHKQNWM